ncbi:MAG: phosphonopyruvate decarboxylase [Treponema sp.]|jgi:phosphonopyruvate decarboxylase|nr:phosphonopyruvate decarboxylase [Treponema sp.]
MIEAAYFYQQLLKNGAGFFSGVPDSLLKSFCAYLTDYAGEENHIIAANEGGAVALAAGFHLATGKIPLVYMQNSGVGNAVNPLLSLADSDVYRIPLILLIGWRGEPGVKDEPQHIKQGKVTCSLLEAMDIPYAVLSGGEGEAERQITACFRHIRKNSSPYALVVRKDAFAAGELQGNRDPPAAPELTREEAIETLITAPSENEVYVATTGMASRELYELREKHRQGHERDFLTLGSMGHASSLAMGAALEGHSVTCIDGDGALLMHLGSLAAIGVRRPRRFRHILINNGAPDSVGGQPTIAPGIDLAGMAKAAGYGGVYSVKSGEELRRVLEGLEGSAGGGEREGPVFIEVKVRKGARKDLGRPGLSPAENKAAFMGYLAKRRNHW